MPLNVFTKLFYRNTSLVYKDLFCAGRSVIQNELTAACQRKEIKYQGPACADATHAFEKCLTVFELINLNAYRLLHPGRAYSLNQTAIGFTTVSSPEGRLQAIIKNCQFIWADDVPGAVQGDGRPLLPATINLREAKPKPPEGCTHQSLTRSTNDSLAAGRWLASEECLLAQGFPSLPCMPDFNETSWSVDRVSQGIHI